MGTVLLLALVIGLVLALTISRETKLDDTETEDCAFAGHCVASYPCRKDRYHAGVCCYCSATIDEALGEAADELED